LLLLINVITSRLQALVLQLPALPKLFLLLMDYLPLDMMNGVLLLLLQATRLVRFNSHSLERLNSLAQLSKQIWFQLIRKWMPSSRRPKTLISKEASKLRRNVQDLQLRMQNVEKKCEEDDGSHSKQCNPQAGVGGGGGGAADFVEGINPGDLFSGASSSPWVPSLVRLQGFAPYGCDRNLWIEKPFAEKQLQEIYS